MRRALRRLGPIALLTTGACFATREDVQLLQSDVRAIRTERSQSDSIARAQLTHQGGARLAAWSRTLDHTP